MPLSPLDVINLALMRIGAEPIATLTEATTRARLMAALYEPTRDETLRAFQWNVSITRIQSLAYTLPSATLTPGTGATVAATAGVTFTAGGGVFLTSDIGRRLRGPDGGTAILTQVTTAAVVLATIGDAWPDLSVIPAGEWKLDFTPPAHTWTYAHLRPADWLAWMPDELEDPTSVSVEGTRLLSNEDALDLTYLRQAPDPAEWDADLTEAIVCHLAAKLAMPISGSVSVQQNMYQLFQGKLKQARVADSSEKRPTV